MCNVEDCLHYDYVRLAWDVGFTFEEYDQKHGFDISVIGLVDVEKVAKERDIPTVVKHIPTLLHFRLDNDIGKVLEPNFIKLFRLSQLSIQYLIFCKKYLDSTVALIKSELVVSNNEKSELEALLNELKAEKDDVYRRYEELKATLSTSTFKCEECTKSFYSEEYLLAHIRRRHQVQNMQMRTEADKLQLEIKELKQRLNSTERLILKDEKNDSIEALSLKETTSANAAEKEKEVESVGPDNDAILEDSIQYKFEQLKTHIESEINSLKDEEFYMAMCEKYIKERVQKSLSTNTPLQNDINKNEDIPQTKEQTREVAIDVSEKIEDNLDTIVKNVNQSIESSTQTDCKKTVVSEGTSMSPQPTPRIHSKPHNHGDTQSLHEVNGHHEEVSEITKEPYSRRTSDAISTLTHDNDRIAIKTMEEKLSREVEHQRETLEHILDLKLSGSLNKMEAQMSAFWQKLNAWETNLTFTNSSSVPSAIVNSEPVQTFGPNGNSVTSEMTIMAPKRLEASHTLNVPKAMPRTINDKEKSVHKSPILIAPKPVEQPKRANGIMTQFLDSSFEEDVQSDIGKSNESHSGQSSSACISEDEKPINIKPVRPTDSFKKHLDETLLHRLKQPGQVPSGLEVRYPPLPKVSEKSNTNKNRTKNVVAQIVEPVQSVQPVKTERNSHHPDPDSRVTDQHTGNDFKNIKRRLKQHVEESVNQKLKDMGVSPHWKGLPDKSYAKAMEIVEHHALLSKRNINDFYTIRKNIERAIDKEIFKTTERNNHSTRINLPMELENEQKSNYIKSSRSSPSTSQTPSILSSEMPPLRNVGKLTIQPSSQQGCVQSSKTFSPIKAKPPPLQTVQSIKNDRRGSKQISPSISEQTDRKEKILGMKATAYETSPMDTIVETASTITNAHHQKKVLFNLDSDTDESEPHLPVKETYVQVHNTKDDKLTTFVQENAKLKSEKQEKSKVNKTEQLGLQTGSGSSDWDISEIA